MRTITKIASAILLVGALSSFDSAQNKEQDYILKQSDAKYTSIKKTVTSFDVNKTTFYKVQVKITGAQTIKGIAKYEELIPAGYTVTGIFSDFGKAVFDSEKAEVTFLSLNGRENVTITYFIQGDLPMTPNGESKFQFLNGDQVASVKVETVE